MPVFYTPRFSYSVPETVISACRQRVVYRGGVRVREGPWAGVLAGYGTRVGSGGLYRVLPSHLASAGTDSEAGPGSPTGAGVGGQYRNAPSVRYAPYPPSGPGRSPVVPSLVRVSA